MDPKRMMGYETPGDKKVPVTVRDWEAMRRAIWRSAQAWEIVAVQACEILDRCEHLPGCPGATSNTEGCLPPKFETAESGALVRVSEGCPDRELRMSALVILNAATQSAPVYVRKPTDDTYFAPSREYFSEVLSSLHAAQLEIESLREKLNQGAAPTEPPPPKEIAS